MLNIQLDKSMGQSITLRWQLPKTFEIYYPFQRTNEKWIYYETRVLNREISVNMIIAQLLSYNGVNNAHNRS